MTRSLTHNLRRARAASRTARTPVVLTWTEYVGGTLNPVTGSRTGATATAQTETVQALVHLIAARTGLVKFAETEVGDCIVDFDPAVVLDGREGLRFTINGVVYEQKQVGDRLTRAWDTIVGGQPTARSVLLARAH